VNENEATTLSIYPNPSSDKLVIESEFLNGSTIVQIINNFGEIVYASTIITKSSTIIDIKFLNNGVYFVKLKNSDGFLTKKIIKN
jgi:hypothetical protein